MTDTLSYGSPLRYDIFEWARRAYGRAPDKIRLDIVLKLGGSAEEVLKRHHALLEQEAAERAVRRTEHETAMLEHLAGSIK